MIFSRTKYLLCKSLFGESMKKDTHPEYQDVLFVDSSTGSKFLIGSTFKTDQIAEFEGKKYPVCHVSVSSASHPFFTGSNQFIDTEGRVDKFTKRYANKLKQNKDEQEKREKVAQEQSQKKRRKKKTT